jgi:hypothetical protein
MECFHETLVRRHFLHNYYINHHIYLKETRDWFICIKCHKAIDSRYFMKNMNKKRCMFDRPWVLMKEKND